MINPDFSSAFNIASFIIALLGAIHILFMAGLIIIKAKTRVHYFNEELESRFKALFILYPSTHFVNRIYFLIIMVAKGLVIGSILINNELVIKIVISIIASSFFINDIF